MVAEYEQIWHVNCTGARNVMRLGQAHGNRERFSSMGAAYRRAGWVGGGGMTGHAGSYDGSILCFSLVESCLACAVASASIRIAPLVQEAFLRTRTAHAHGRSYMLLFKHGCCAAGHAPT